jgi:cytochrome P450
MEEHYLHHSHLIIAPFLDPSFASRRSSIPRPRVVSCSKQTGLSGISMADLKEDPSLAPKFVEELCRYHTASANALRRVAKVDIELGGKTIRAGDGIICSNMSANRDAEIFPDPDKFDMHQKRGPEKALGFGYGPHECVAEWLARAELETVFGK